MKKSILIIILMLSNTILIAQNGFNYKALISDNGNVLANQVISIKFTVLENGTTSVYQETQTGNTDANGIIAFNIGEGSVVSGDFTTIDWGSNPYFLKVEINTGSGYQDFGTTELKYVPYAKFAEKAGNVFSGDFGDLNNVPTGLSDGDDDTHLTDAQIAAMGYIKDPNDADHDATNELQTISKTGNTVTLSNGGGSFTDADTHLTDADISGMGYIKNADDADHDATNEIQNLTLSGTNLSISSGNTVHFNNWDTNANDDVHSINDLSDAKSDISSIFLGAYAGENDDQTQNYNVGVGYQAMNANTSGDNNTALGYYAMINNTTGKYNTATGAYALKENTSADHNTADGYQALNSNSTGAYNTAVGSQALYHTTRSNNTAVGYQALYNNTGEYNTALGSGALYSGTNTDYNVAIGYNAGYSANSIGYNVFVGYNAGKNATGYRNVFIGYQAGRDETGDEKLYIDDSSTPNPLIYGDFSTNELTINGSLAIKDGTQGAGKVLVSDANGKGQWSNTLPKQNRIASFGPLDATMFNGASLNYLIKSPYNGAFNSSSSDNSAVYIPIKLPDGAIINDIYVYYKDNSTYNYMISFFKCRITAFNSAQIIASYITSGSNSSIAFKHSSMSITVSSDYQYYVRMQPLTSSHHWSNYNSVLKGVVVYYQR